MTGEQATAPDGINAADLILGPALAAGRQGDTALLHRESAMTFGELDAFANRVGNALRPRVGRGDRVLMLLRDSPLFVAAFLGIMRVGAVAVPLNVRSSPRDLAFAIADSEAPVLLIDDEFVPLYRKAVEAGDRAVPLLAVSGSPPAGAQPLDELLDDASPRLDSAPMNRDDMAFWLYTSGTTGTPKGAVHCHGDVVVGDWYMQQFGLGPGQRVFASSKLFFAFSLGHTLVGGLRAGATVVLYDGWPDSEAIARVVDRYRPHVMLSVPTFFRNLLRDGHAASDGFRSVRAYLSAGEALPESLYRRWLEETGVPIVEGIGATETLFMFISGTPADHRPGVTGKPMPYAEVKLLDEGGRPITRAGEPGIAWITMGSLCRGYWRQPEKTELAFRDGWFRTGDMYSIEPDGCWRHHGRGDDLLKISGQWVSPGEIEEHAVSIPGIAEAAVVGRENDDGLVRMTLFLVADSSVRPTMFDELAGKVTERLRASLSVYKCPRDVRFVESIPRTATGKVQRYRLRQIAGETAPAS